MLHTSVKLGPGTYYASFKLPATLLPGTYGISLTPSSPLVAPATSTAKLAAPAEGVVDVAFLSAARLGKAAHSLIGARTVWASFHFAALPKGEGHADLVPRRAGQAAPPRDREQGPGGEDPRLAGAARQARDDHSRCSRARARSIAQATVRVQ